MADLAYTQQELLAKQKKMEPHAPAIGDMEKYPWGTRLRLDNDTIKKLGMSAQIGQEVKFSAVAKVVEMEATEEVDGDVRQHLALQVTQMDLDSGVDRKAQADKLYGNNGGQ